MVSKSLYSQAFDPIEMAHLPIPCNITTSATPPALNILTFPPLKLPATTTYRGRHNALLYSEDVI